jgi:hypothetical protein
VALDVPSVDEARMLIGQLDGVVSFFKIGLWLRFAAGFERIRRGKKVFPSTVATASGEDRGLEITIRNHSLILVRQRFINAGYRNPTRLAVVLKFLDVFALASLHRRVAAWNP